MNKLPLLLSVFLCGVMYALSLPILLLIWILGGVNVFTNYTWMLALIIGLQKEN